MSVNIYSIERYLLQLLNVKEFEDPLVNGLQVEGSRPLHRIASAVTVSQESIEKARSLQADILLVHHGLMFQTAPAIKGILRQRLSSLLQSGMHLFTFHLPLDAHEIYGNVWPVARHFGWRDAQPFGNTRGRYIGVKGTIQTTDAHELFSTLSHYWGTKGTHLTSDPKKQITTCAFVSGGGHRFYQEAIEEQVDCFITGTISDTIWHLARESSCHFMSFGHVATEKLGVQLLGAHIAQTFGLEHFFVDEPNPF